MKVLVFDKDALSTQLLRSKLEPLGHEVAEAALNTHEGERALFDPVDIVCLDPSPLTNLRQAFMQVRRCVPGYPYIFLLSPEAGREDAIKAGMNDVLAKPLDIEATLEKFQNAERLINVMRRIGDDSEDFPSAGGVIAKSAFNQLFLSAIDRAGRYGEHSYVLFISLDNYAEIRQMDGPYAADYAAAKLSQHIVQLRRQSDIIGQTAKFEYSLILQRPAYESEPMDAANRFIEAMDKFDDILSSGAQAANIKISLLEVPVGLSLAEQIIRHEKKS